MFSPGKLGREASREIWSFEVSRVSGNLCQYPGNFCYINKNLNLYHIHYSNKNLNLYFSVSSDLRLILFQCFFQTLVVGFITPSFGGRARITSLQDDFKWSCFLTFLCFSYRKINVSCFPENKCFLLYRCVVHLTKFGRKSHSKLKRATCDPRAAGSPPLAYTQSCVIV